MANASALSFLRFSPSSKSWNLTTYSSVVNALGQKELQHIYDYADVYHCENIDKVSDELIEKHKIEEGYFDNILNARFSVPSHWDIGKVYQRLILDVAHATDNDIISTLMMIYNSWIARKIDDYNSSMYYESPSYLLESYKAGTVLA